MQVTLRCAGPSVLINSVVIITSWFTVPTGTDSLLISKRDKMSKCVALNITDSQLNAINHLYRDNGWRFQYSGEFIIKHKHLNFHIGV